MMQNIEIHRGICHCCQWPCLLSPSAAVPFSNTLAWSTQLLFSHSYTYLCLFIPVSAFLSRKSKFLLSGPWSDSPGYFSCAQTPHRLLMQSSPSPLHYYLFSLCPGLEVSTLLPLSKPFTNVCHDNISSWSKQNYNILIKKYIFIIPLKLWHLIYINSLALCDLYLHVFSFGLGLPHNASPHQSNQSHWSPRVLYTGTLCC